MTKEEYVGVLEPALREGIESGELRLLVTDEEWVARAMRIFTWMTPGEVLIAELGEEEEAKRWVAG